MLERNKLLEEIAYQLAYAEPDWDQIITRFLNTPYGGSGYYDDTNLKARLSEIHLRNALERICLQYGERVVFDPIPSGAKAGRYIFEIDEKTDNLVVRVAKEKIRKNWAERNRLVSLGLIEESTEPPVYSIFSNTNEYSEIDLLMTADGLPVLFEIKLTNLHLCSENAKVPPSSRGINYAMRPGRVADIIDPLLEYFKTGSCAYVLVVPEDLLMPDNKVQKKFTEELGGIIVPFYTDRKTFREYVEIAKEIYDL